MKKNPSKSKVKASTDENVRMLLESEENFRLIFENNSAAMAIIEPDTTISMVNEEYCRMSGYTKEEVIGMSWTQQIPPEDLERLKEFNRLRLLNPKDAPDKYEFSFYKKNGKITNALMSISMIGNHKIITSFIDITERKKAEEALEGRDIRFLKLSSHVPGMIYQFMKKPDGTYCVPFTTEAIRDVFGCSPQDVREDFSPIANVILKEDLEKVISSIDYSGKNLTTWKCEYRVKIPGQPVRWMLGQSTPEKQADGSIIWHGFNSDITDRKQSEMMLRKLNRTYALLSEINRTIIWVHKPLELYEAVCNIAIGEGGFRMAWIGMVDPQTKNVIPVASAGKTENYLEKLQITLDNSERGLGPTAIALRDGKHSVANDIASDPRMTPWREDALRLGYRASAVFPFKIAGKLRGALTLYASEANFFDDEELTLLDEMAANISFAMEFAEEEEQRIRAEKELHIAKNKAEESDRLKSTFLANMSHEIRTPMNAIVGFSDMLSDPDLSYEDRRRYSGIIQSRSDDLMHLINDLLDISRIESGNATIYKTAVSLNNILDELEVVFQQKIEKNNITGIKIKAEKKLPGEQVIIKTDRFILKQVFSNLIDNAIKFTDAGVIGFGYHPPEDKTITCYVADTGIGISAENQEVIFEHFRQAAVQNPKKLYGGTGLGLSICKGSLALLGGEIWVDSVPGKGSTFFFKFPYEPEQEKNQPATDGPGTKKAESNYNWSGKKIMLVEDEQSNMDYLKIILRKTGADLTPVFSGKELRAQYENLSSYDLILLDVRLPDASGWDLAREIKALLPQLPVISQTAYAMSTDKEKSKESGCDGYISKPINKSELFMTISKLITKEKTS